MKAENPDLALAIFDHIQLMTAEGAMAGEQQMTVISQSLKNAAKVSDVPLIAVSQLSRALERIKGETPALMHLRGSGMIGANADTVFFVHRDDYEDIETNTFDSPVSDAVLLVAKQRNGPLGAIRHTFHRGCSKFTEVPR